MKERPILFSAPMVRALLDGRKTQTRRIVKPRRDRDVGCELAPHEIAGEVNQGVYRNAYCEPGDRLWVRETWYDASSALHSCVLYRADGDDIYGGKWRPSIRMPRWVSRITLEVTGVRVEKLQDISGDDSIAEGIERADDFFGCPCWRAYGEPAGADVVCPDDPVGSYRSLWESINGPGSWDANPWVWVIEFRRLP